MGKENIGRKDTPRDHLLLFLCTSVYVVAPYVTESRVSSLDSVYCSILRKYVALYDVDDNDTPSSEPES